RSGATLGTFEEEKVREGLRTGEFIGTDLGWMEGMATWRPLSELDDFRTAPPPAEPVAPDATPTAEVASPAVVATGSVTGLPWENREQVGWLNALFETIQMVLLRPAEAFTAMRRGGGFLDPLLYTLILGMIGAVISFILSFGLRSFGLGSSNGLGTMMGMGAASFGMLVLMPVIIILSTFIFAGLIHLVLTLLGGAKLSFEATLRVVCYASGSAGVLQIIPLCGGLIAMVYSIVLNCQGIARVHETDTGKALIAVLSPVLLCCGGAIFFAVMVGGLAAAGANWH
ncbi:MAG: YIP1 family protein, partial [Chthoniobacterales bacterium]